MVVRSKISKILGDDTTNNLQVILATGLIGLPVRGQEGNVIGRVINVEGDYFIAEVDDDYIQPMLNKQTICTFEIREEKTYG